MRISDWSSDVCAGEQRGGEGVAGEALVAPPIEGEAERPAAVDEAAAVETKAAHATPRSRFGSAAAQGPTISAPPILCVTVSRATVSQRRKPRPGGQGSRAQEGRGGEERG